MIFVSICGSQYWSSTGRWVHQCTNILSDFFLTMSPKVATSTDILFLNSLVNTNTEGSQKVRFNIIFVIVNFVIIPIIIIIIITVLVNTPIEGSQRWASTYIWVSFCKTWKIPYLCPFYSSWKIYSDYFPLFFCFLCSSSTTRLFHVNNIDDEL